MPRVNHVKKARKDQGACGRCGTEIKRGDPYRHWSFRYGGRHVRCMAPGCTPKASELTNNEKLSTFYAALEDLSSTKATTLEEVQEAIREAAEQVQEVAEAYESIAAELEGLADEEDEERKPADLLDEAVAAMEEFSY